MKCPVCRADILPLVEGCMACGFEWKLGQEGCPASLFIGPHTFHCELEFNHTALKHRATGVQLDNVELTLSWFHPTPDLNRSADYRRRHGI